MRILRKLKNLEKELGLPNGKVRGDRDLSRGLPLGDEGERIQGLKVAYGSRRVRKITQI